jgi:hypothetical protein
MMHRTIYLLHAPQMQMIVFKNFMSFQCKAFYFDTAMECADHTGAKFPFFLIDNKISADISSSHIHRSGGAAMNVAFD